ncbi:MAG: amidase family protein [Candidatus Planktophila sp.]|nr:amidase family protein [Candidatus Planktophila sp.]
MAFDSFKHYVSAIDSIQNLRAGVETAESLAAQALDRIEVIDTTGYELNSILAIAHQSDEGTFDSNSPLAGLPIVIKDNIEAIGLPGTAGSTALLDHLVVHDSLVTKRLRAAGANIIAATNLSEWANIRSASSTSGWSAVGGLTANPWIHSHSAGGSSSGSGAAIAAGLVSLAVGTETDGSIICPASLNGCVGIKPTVGRVPTQGIVPISSSQDSPGPLARTVKDAALLLEILSATTGLVAASDDLQNLRVGVVRSWLTGHSATDAIFESALSQLSRAGMTLIEVHIDTPSDDVGNDEYEVLLHELYEDLGAYLTVRADTTLKSLADVVAYNLAHKESELKFFGQELFEKALTLGGRNSAYQAKRARNLAWAQKTLADAFVGVDVLIGATYSPAWKSTLDTGDDYGENSWITMAPAIAGAPIGTVPMGICEGLPVGLGVVAPSHDELHLVTALAQIERVLDLGVLVPTFKK